MSLLQGKVALITGSASGIGRATALMAAAAGARVVLADIDLQGLEETRKMIDSTAADADVRTCVFDATDPDSCRQCIDHAVEVFGQLDVLCNIAGIYLPAHFCELKLTDWRKLMSVNLDSVFVLCQAAIPLLKETRGNIVNLASISGLVGQAYNAGYCASKGGVVMLTKALAVEFARDGIRVNAVCPAGVDTPLNSKFTFPENTDALLLGRMSSLLEGEPLASAQDVAQAVLYLASDQARYITGVALPMDGGQSA